MRICICIWLHILPKIMYFDRSFDICERESLCPSFKILVILVFCIQMHSIFYIS